LLAHARPTPVGRAWHGAAANKPVAGFSHGQSGIAWALGALFGATGAPRFRAAAADAVRFERTLYAPALRNWPNTLGAEPHDQHAWCHGAPGVGLARLGLRTYLDDAATDAELAIAIETTRTRGFSEQHCLCHGSLGNLELLLTAARDGDRAELAADIDRQLARTLADIRTRGWHCGVPLGVETPGLLTGVAGIGYALLRHVDASIPSVLTLAPPR
jgi:lantibiotic modifying enzyme